MTVHGGNVTAAAAELGIAPEELLDFSANISPRGLPQPALRRLLRDAASPALLERYPDPDALELRSALSSRLRVRESSIVIGCGAEALIAASVRALAPRSCLIPIPAFSEYARVCEANGCAIERIALDPDREFQLNAERVSVLLSSRAHDLLILNSPHNPSGAVWDKHGLWTVLDAAAQAGTAVLLDEAFVDYVPECSLSREASALPRVVAIRSLTKFFGCPALRVGYAVAHEPLARAIRNQLPTWSVTTLALNAAVEMLADERWERETIAENRRGREQLRSALSAAGCTVFPSCANFVLARLPEHSVSSSELCCKLLQAHRIMLRNCDSYEGLAQGRYVRAAVKLPAENDRLIAAFHQLLGERK